TRITDPTHVRQIFVLGASSTGTSRSVGNIVMTTRRMVDIVATRATSGATFQQGDLMHQSVIARQHHASAVQQRYQLAIELVFALLARPVAHAMLLEGFGSKARSPAVANDRSHAIGLEHLTIVGNNRLRRERRSDLTHTIENHLVAILVRNANCEAIATRARRTAGGVRERAVANAWHRG